MADESNIRDWINEAAEGAVVLDGLDDAIIGIGTRCASAPVLIYDREKILDIFVERDGLSIEEADEHVSFNIEGLYAGDRTPIIMQRPPEQEDE